MSDPLPNSDAPDQDMHPVAQALFGWVTWRWTPALFFWGLGLLTLGLVAADLLLDRHEYLSMANATGFYAIYGFAAFAFVVLMGWPLGRFLRRDENYYGDADDPAEPPDGETRG